MLIGTEGSMLIPLGTPPQLLPEDKFSNVQRPKLPPRNHYHHFVDACLGGEKTESHFGQTGPMTRPSARDGGGASARPKAGWDNADEIHHRPKPTNIYGAVTAIWLVAQF
jgi:hypothetical protein